MITLDVIPSPRELGETDLNGHVCLVIDVLRATSSMTLAFASGVRAIIPAKDEKEALSLKREYPFALLAGEKDGDKIPGFHLGNSPKEYMGDSLRGQVVIMTTSNGTRAIRKAIEKGAGKILIASFLNLDAAAKESVNELLSLGGGHISVICSGSHGEFSSEDFSCAGALIKAQIAFGKKGKDVEIRITERAQKAVKAFSSQGKDVLQTLNESFHGRYLKSKGYGDDLALCARLNTINLVPYMKGDQLVVDPTVF